MGQRGKTTGAMVNDSRGVGPGQNCKLVGAVDEMDSLAIGVDLGGTHVLAVLMDPSGCIHTRHEARLAAEDRSSQEKIVAVMGTCIMQCWRYAREHFAERLPLAGLGIAVPGNVDPAHGLARYLPNFGWLEPVDLTARVLNVRVDGVSCTPPSPELRAPSPEPRATSHETRAPSLAQTQTLTLAYRGLRPELGEHPGRRPQTRARARAPA